MKEAKENENENKNSKSIINIIRACNIDYLRRHLRPKGGREMLIGQFDLVMTYYTFCHMRPQVAMFEIYIRDSIALRFEPFKRMYETVRKSL